MAFDANDLSPIEAHVVDRTRDGEIADFTPMLGPDGAKPVIRSGFLRRLLLQLSPEWPVRMPGVRIRGARIEGVLDLSDCSGAGGAGLPALELLECEAPERMDLSHARLARLALDGSRLIGLKARHARFDGPLSLAGAAGLGPEAVCAFDLEGAQIDGALEAKDAKLRCDPTLPREDRIGVFALNLRNARIAGNVNLRPGMVAIGGVSLFGARVGGTADLRGARLTVNHRYALSAGNLDVAGPLHLNAGFRAEGPIWLRGARLGDGLHCDGGAIALADERQEIDALNAEGCVIEGGVSLRNGFTSNGALNFRSAHIRGGVSVAKAQFAAAKPFTLDARNCVIDGEVAGDAVSKGGFNFAGAAISHNFDLSGADITAAPGGGGLEYGTALDATSARIGGALRLRNAKVKGEVMLADARIEGYAPFGGGRFINPGGWAIRAPNCRIGGNLTFKPGDQSDDTPFAAKTVIEGGAKFARADIEGEVVWDGLELRGKGPEGGPPCLSFNDARIGRALRATALTAQNALIDLSGASCAALEDDLAKGWGLSSTLIALEGFAYARLDCAPGDFRWSARTRWLRERAARRSPQPYAALARVYAEAGRNEDMRRALRAQHDLTTRATPLLSPTRFFSALFGFFSGYGLSPTRAAAALSAFLLIGMAGVFVMDWRGVLVTPEGAPCAGAVEPVLYAIDVALPVIDLGQQSACAPGHATGAALFAGLPLPRQNWRLFED
ncbi:MAG: hypothetical protein AB7L65_06990, partial [Hyphomonadaceae bacterium]